VGQQRPDQLLVITDPANTLLGGVGHLHDGVAGEVGQLDALQVRPEVFDTPSVQQANRHLLRELGWQQISPQDLEQIAVPTTLIWGRQDRVMPLRTAQEASARYGWPLQVIDDAGHFLVADQPEAFLAALQDALGDR
jgi:pimeloyl-ACP methyl ester carboxylesterase